MPNPHGSFIWYELLASDPDAAQAFYADVIGWSIAPGGYPGMDYRIISAPDGDAVAGLMKQPEGMQGGPVWLTYIGVEDVDAAVADIVAAGGAVHMPPTTMDEVGRMAMVTDPFGAAFYVMRGVGEEPSRAFLVGQDSAPGHAVWNELTSADPDGAIGFYTDRFGWRQDGAMPMGELGDDRFLYQGTHMIGAVMGPVPGMRPGWQFYFMVQDIDVSVERIRAGGGTVLQGPDEIPGGSFTVMAADPQGARFGLAGERKS